MAELTFLDRDGTERTEVDGLEHDPLCDGHGWLLTSTLEVVYPCLDCRPHLRGRLRPRVVTCSG